MTYPCYNKQVLLIADVNTINIDFWFTCEKEQRNEWCLHYDAAGPPPFDYCIHMNHYPIKHCSKKLVQIAQLHWLIDKAKKRIFKLAMEEK